MERDGPLGVVGYRVVAYVPGGSVHDVVDALAVVHEHGGARWACASHEGAYCCHEVGLFLMWPRRAYPCVPVAQENGLGCFVCAPEEAEASVMRVPCAVPRVGVGEGVEV